MPGGCHTVPMSRDVELVDGRKVVVTAFALNPAAQARLAEQLDHWRVVDIRTSVDHVDLVLAPSCSPQTVAALQEAYPTARIVVVELEDDDLDVDLPGPVKRLLAAGAVGYVTADSVDDLAQQLSPSSDASRPADSTGDRELASPGVDDAILAALREQRSQRDPTPRRRVDG